ncbi:MAG: helix-turn-helix transcriptional regulator [Clostridia bacterium]|nr:helix-turn-helix transcriptional regulator [Clostridia bacterium]
MKSLSYYAFADSEAHGFNACSRECDKYPLMVNCTGFMSLSHRFTTYNRRGRDDYYLIYVAHGELSVVLDGESATVSEGDFVIFPPRCRYCYTFSGEGEIGYYFVHFTGSAADSTLESLGFTNLPTAVKGGHSERATRAFSEMFSSFSEDGDCLDVCFGGYLAVILSSLAGLGRAGKSERLTRSLQYINAYYAEPISVPELAHLDSISVSRYNTVFRAITGMSPTQYIASLRINYASSLLSSTDIDIGRIGEMVGYADKHFFSKTFRKHTGMSPREYRQKTKGAP